MPGTHKDGRGGFPVSPSIVIPGSVIPRPSCKHIYGGRSAVTWNAVRPAPEQGVMSL